MSHSIAAAPAKHTEHPDTGKPGHDGMNAYQQRHNKRLAGMWLITAMLMGAGLLALVSGSYAVPLADLLFHSIQPGALPAELATPGYIVAELRLPRVVMAAMIGAMLAMAGCAMQGLVRNPLADPGLIGVSGGAAAAAAVALAIAPPVLGALAPVWVSLWAFAGALLAVWLVIRFSRTAAGLSVATLILAGVAINALTGTVIGGVSYVASDDALRQITYWTMGSLAGANWSVCLVIAVSAMCSCGWLLRCRQPLNLLALGEKEARYLGLNVARYRTQILWVVAFAVSMATALCGIIGFVGLVVPHIGRTLFGVDHRYLMPVCGVTGALLLVVADTFSRSVFAPVEVPIGIVTSAIGAPFFLYLLWQQRERAGVGI